MLRRMLLVAWLVLCALTTRMGPLTGRQHDAVGNPTQVAVGPAAGTPIRTDAYRYDARDDRVEQDTGGVMLTATLTTLSAPNPDGLVAQVQAPDGDLTTYSYDPADERTGTPTPASEADYYDRWGNPTEHVSWAGQDQSLTLDAAGRPTLEVDSTSQTGGVQTISTGSGYDLDGNLLTRSVTERLAGPTGTSTPTTASYSYAATPNALDWTVQATDSGLATTYGYDALGRLRTLTLPLPAPFATGTGTATPTVTGTVTTVVSYGVDNAGMLRSIAEGPGGTATPVATALFVPNRDGELVSAQLPGGVRVANSIDGAGRVIAVKITNSTATGTGTPTPVAQFDYRYDVLGRTTGETDTVGVPGGSVTMAFASVTPDATGRLTQLMAGPRLLHYSYDGAGNQQALLVNGQPGGQYTYAQGNPDELTGVSGAAVPTVALGAYDADGNPGTIGDGAHTALAGYDTRGRLQDLLRSDDSSGAELAYDAQGQRTGMVIFSPLPAHVTTYSLGYRYRGGELAQLAVTQDVPAATNTPVPAECAPSDPQGCTETFVHRQDGAPYELLYTRARDNATQRYWYETDAHGSVVALTKADGTVVDKYVYGAWGDLDTLHSAEMVPQPLLYRGYVYDRELHGPGEASGWYWLSVRSYDPNIGRFIQPDPSEQEGTRSYVYCGDDPLDCSDPSGLGPFGTCIPFFESCRLPTGDEAKQVGYGVANEAAGALDAVSFGAFSHVAGAVGARVDTGSADYQAGLIGGSLALIALTGGSDAEADATVAGETDEITGLSHGTTSENAQAIRANGIRLSHPDIRTDLDFNPAGRPGFYATRDYQQALGWAGGDAEGVVEFKVSQADLNALNHKVFSGADDEWADFVLKGRLGMLEHSYDWVEGPVLAVTNLAKLLARGPRAAKGLSQLGIFSSDAVGILNAGRVP